MSHNQHAGDAGHGPVDSRECQRAQLRCFACSQGVLYICIYIYIYRYMLISIMVHIFTCHTNAYWQFFCNTNVIYIYRYIPQQRCYSRARRRWVSWQPWMPVDHASGRWQWCWWHHVTAWGTRHLALGSVWMEEMQGSEIKTIRCVPGSCKWSEMRSL